MKSVEVVCAVIFNNQGEVYIARRGSGRALEGYYEFPGGKVEANETLEETITREIKEELDSVIKPVKYLLTTEYTYPERNGFDGFHIKLHAYECLLIKGELKSNEHTDTRFVKVSNINKYLFAEADLPVVNVLLQR